MNKSEEKFSSPQLSIGVTDTIDDAISWSSSGEEASDTDFCSDDDLLSASGSKTKLQTRKAAIKACWNDELCMAEVVHHKCHLLISLGIVCNGQIYLSIEETLFLVEIGALILVDNEDIVGSINVSLKDLYDKVSGGKGGCSWEHFEVYRYLKSLGYIVGRHGTQWSGKIVKHGLSSIEGTSEKEGIIPIALDGIAELLKGVQIGEMTPFFDVYLPNSKFRKTSPGDPAFKVYLARHQPPSRSDIEELEKLCREIPLKIVHVDHGRVTFFSFNRVDLPLMQ